MPVGLLEGVRVLDLGSHVSGPFCAKALADYGADVIKVEPPDVGDEARRTGPFVGDDPHPDKSVPFLYLNTNKRGVTLDQGSDSGRLILKELLQRADVLVENFAPAQAETLGLDYAGLSEMKPDLVVTSITPFGQTGPYRDLAAADIVTCAVSGLMYHSGDSDREPLRNSLDQSLYVAGANGAAATLAALFQRFVHGRRATRGCLGCRKFGLPSGPSGALLQLYGGHQGAPPRPRLRIRGADAGQGRLRSPLGPRLSTLVGDRRVDRGERVG